MSDEAKPAEATSGTTTDLASANQDIGLKLETENLVETYSVVAEWIRFADAKAAVVLTVEAAIAGLLIPTLKEYLAEDASSHMTSWWSSLVVVLFALWLITTIATFVWAFLCVLPFRLRGRHPSLDRCAHFHPAAIAQKYKIDAFDEFVAGYEAAGVDGFQREVLAGLLIDSHISNVKYGRVTRSIQLLAVSAVIGLTYLLAIQL